MKLNYFYQQHFTHLYTFSNFVYVRYAHQDTVLCGL